MNRKSYVGERFGKLLVTEMVYTKENGRYRTYCRCICECGNNILTTVDSLRRTKRSCGCDTSQRRKESIRKDLTGRRFNRLVVEEMLWDSKPTKCRCRCDCGSEVVVIGTGLTSGKTGSCGCYHRDKTSASNIKDWSGILSPHGVEFISQYSKNDKGQWLWLCKCGECRSEFIALPAKVMNGHTTSCGCRKKSSREEMISSILDNAGVEYIEQYRFPDCKHKHSLPFDFAVVNNGAVSLLIEYDGPQHYSPISCFGGEDEFIKTKMRDSIKNNYCKDNDYRLLRLPYTLSDDRIKEEIIDAIYP